MDEIKVALQCISKPNISSSRKCEANLKTIKSDFQCIICVDITGDPQPHITKCCHSISCNDCKRRWKNQTDTCPACRRTNPQQVPLQVQRSAMKFVNLHLVAIMSQTKTTKIYWKLILSIFQITIYFSKKTMFLSLNI